MKKPFTILAAVDFSDASLEALAWGVRLAGITGGDLVLLAVTDWPGRPAGSEAQFPAFYDADEGLRIVLEKRLQNLAESFLSQTRPPRKIVRFGHPEQEIIKAAKEEGADLIVMGTHGRKGVARALLGSVAEGVLRNAPCPVTVFRQGVHPAPENLLAAAAAEKTA
jgi:universal stress protein A